MQLKKAFSSAALVVALGLGATGSASAQDVLTGDTRLACEAILCLSTGSRPSECSPSLSRYFGIHKRKLSDTLKARLNFLNLCPVSNQTPEMQTLVSAISRGAGRCDASSLNSVLREWRSWDDQFYIGNRLPDYCASYTGHAYTDFNTSAPRYVGTPEEGGYWVEAADYDRALKEYEAKLKERQQQYGRYGSDAYRRFER
ncbi:TrbM/KikA/MpfK family conjugal transfer protein [Rhizobium sp. LC145]|uniref:TrbM/KikA/MpfK family conjugal transfer protein n=1 Tax=Rhizobium sp. LC145 TaxID=1120688 RepID=UPI00062A4BE0|nr:TrbM/KikA/MpfK family conjugal transfer protein [Rhizobium sp. LC145]KKX24157.1 conjugal transfer protein TrbM [Rhizobium sp. LC145]TKT46055.1 conjugal transfer protein TrbM [Rhizobiaceae bacterium LC148]